MPMPQIKPGLAGIFLGLVSAALLVNSPIVHPQENAGQPSATQSEGGGASGATSTTTTTTTESAGASEIRLSQSDERMLKQLAQAHLSEINLGKLAQDKAQSDEVKSFAKKMVDDYTKAQDELRQLAQSKSITLPTEPDRQQQSVEKKLAAKPSLKESVIKAASKLIAKAKPLSKEQLKAQKEKDKAFALKEKARLDKEKAKALVKTDKDFR